MGTKRAQVKGFTVDSSTSWDLDDAIWIEKKEEGWDFQVSIADVSSQVVLGSHIDQKALEKAFTRYYAHGNDPMLPRYLSDKELSLLPRVKRKTITFFISLDKKLEVKDLSIKRTRLKSSKKMTYSEVDQILDNTGHKQHEWWKSAYELAQGLLNKRSDAGALVVFDLQKGLITNEEGEVSKIPHGKHYRAYLIVQELMILVNYQATVYLHGEGVPLLFRNHTTRQDDVQENYLCLLKDLLLEPTAQQLRDLSRNCRHLMNRARYEPELQGHFALQLSAYTHWTSPIRRYADLINHRQLVAWLKKEPFPYPPDRLKEMGDHLNQKSDETRDARSDSFKNRQINRLQCMSKSQLAVLELKEFSYFVQKLTEGLYLLNADRVGVVKERLSSGSVSVNDVSRLLFSGHPSVGEWGVLREAAFAWLCKNSQQVSGVIHNAHLLCGSPSLDDIVYKRTLDQGAHALHSVSVTFHYAGEDYAAGPVVDSSLKQAEQMAQLELVAHIFGFSLSDMKVKGETIEMKYSNPKGKLQELCQKRQLMNPDYKNKQSGPPHMMTFGCVVSIKVNEQTYQSDSVTGSSKKRAQHLAADNLLQKLPRDLLSEPEKKVIDHSAAAEMNPVGALQEWAQRQKLSLPSYAYNSETEGDITVFVSTCSVMTSEGVTQSWQGVGANKKTAKVNAAAEACKSLLK